MVTRQRIYVDESGIGDGDRFCLVAGYMASAAKWKRFDRDWLTILNKPQYRIKDGFHGKVFFNRNLIKDPKRNPYLGWSDLKANVFLDELLVAITQNKIYPVSGVVDVAAFRMLSFAEQCVLVGYLARKSRRQNRDPQPYHLAMRVLIEDVVQEAAPESELHFVIAEQPALQQRALDGYHSLKETWSNVTHEPEHTYAARLQSMVPESPNDYPGLQAADLYANRAFHSLSRDRRVNAWNQRIMNHLSRRRNAVSFVGAAEMEQRLTHAIPSEKRLAFKFWGPETFKGH